MFKYRLLASALALSLAFGTSVASAQNEPASGYPLFRGNPGLETHGKYIDELVADFIAKNHLPGLSMAIVQAPYIPRSAGYGVTSLVNDELASTRTMWNVGPITQAFTAVSIFQLVEAGKLGIHDEVGKYVDGLPSSWKRLTILELLQHATGIPDYRFAKGYDASHAYQPADLLALVKGDPVLFKSGTQVRLSATDSALLGLVIERASGMSYRDYVTRYQIEPLGLRSTMFVEDFAQRSRLDRPAPSTVHNQHVRFTTTADYIDPVEPATGYVESHGTMVPVKADESANLFAFGSVWSSADDISTWDIGLAGSVLVKSAEDRKMIYSPTTLPNGTVVPAMAGWEFTHHPGFMEVKGSSPGFSSYLSRFTARTELVCVTLLTDKEGVDLTALARDIAEAYQPSLGSGLDSDKIVTEESKFDVPETEARIKSVLKKLDVPVFATFDHGANASEVGMTLRPTVVVVFGNPKLGTRLMLDQQPAALDLPLRVAVWQDARGRVWIGYHNIQDLAKTWGLKDEASIAKVSEFMANVVRQSANVYQY
jgi:CubicO group peptidase (beta-lactamase class C family)/uncharacterized protein (DUF302 family)